MSISNLIIPGKNSIPIPKNYEEQQKIHRRKEAELLAAADIKDKIKMLQSKMDKAIKLENYEVAGVLKNKIQELKDFLKPES